MKAPVTEKAALVQPEYSAGANRMNRRPAPEHAPRTARIVRSVRAPCSATPNNAARAVN